jgi:hypothetical protein
MAGGRLAFQKAATLRCHAFVSLKNVMMRIAVLIGILGLAGCQSAGSVPMASSGCSFDQVWDTAIASLDGGRLESADKASGQVETAWLEIASNTQAGLFERNVNKERVKYLVEVKSAPSGAKATVQQLREEWSPMGVQMRQWRAIPADGLEETQLVNEISRRLKAKGC